MNLRKKLLSSIALVTILPGIVGMSISLLVARDIIIRNTGIVLSSVAESYERDIAKLVKIDHDGNTLADPADFQHLAELEHDHHMMAGTYHVDVVRGDGVVVYDSLGDTDEIFSQKEMSSIRSADFGWLEGTRHGITFVSGYKRMHLPVGSEIAPEPVYIVVSRDQKTLQQDLVTFFLRVSLPSVMVIMLIMGGWYYASNRQIIRPLSLLHRGVIAVGKGDLNQRVAADTGDEIEELADAFNAMVGNVKASREKLEAVMVRDKKRASIGTLAAGIAHELNNPLTAVIGFADTMKRRAGEGTLDMEAASRLAVKIHDAGWRCVKIIDSLKSYARESTWDRREEDVNDLIRSSLLLVGHQFKSWASIEIVHDLCEPLPPVLCDRNRLQQVLINLLINARDAMPRGGTITVRTRSGDRASLFGIEHVVIEVEDSGDGIPPHNLDRLFDPFFTTKGVGEGTGLGLSICHGIITSHGGTIVAANRTQADGALFTIRLPLRHEGAKPVAGPTDRFGDPLDSAPAKDTPA